MNCGSRVVKSTAFYKDLSNLYLKDVNNPQFNQPYDTKMIKLIFDRLACFDMKSTIPLLFLLICALVFEK